MEDVIRPARSSLKISKLPLALILCSFGPYLMEQYGLRLEHVAIYPLVPIAFLLLAARRRTVLSFAPLMAVFALLAGIAVWTLAVTFLGEKSNATFLQVVAGVENYAQPVAILLICGAFVRVDCEEAGLLALRRASQLFIHLLLLNTLLVVASVFVDISGPLHAFTGAVASDGLTVSDRAAALGRYCGIFDQPMQSGLSYSLGLLAWGYLKSPKSVVSVSDYAQLLCLTLGGLMSVSKVFILLGLPLGVVYWLLQGRIRRVLNWRVLIAGATSAAVATYVLSRWNGLDYLTRSLYHYSGSNTESSLAFYSAGRFGSEHAFVDLLIARVWDHSPLFGLGFAAVPFFDNGYMEFFVQGGLIALGGYVMLLVCVGILAIDQTRKGYREGSLLLALLTLVIGGGLGAPVTTMNRFSTVLWVLLLLLSCLADVRRRARSHSVAADAADRAGRSALSRLVLAGKQS